MCQMSGVTWQVSGVKSGVRCQVRCQVSGVRCNVSIFFFFYKVVELGGGGFLIKGASPSSLVYWSYLWPLYFSLSILLINFLRREQKHLVEYLQVNTEDILLSSTSSSDWTLPFPTQQPNKRSKSFSLSVCLGLLTSYCWKNVCLGLTNQLWQECI